MADKHNPNPPPKHPPGPKAAPAGPKAAPGPKGAPGPKAAAVTPRPPEQDHDDSAPRAPRDVVGRPIEQPLMGPPSAPDINPPGPTPDPKDPTKLVDEED